MVAKYYRTPNESCISLKEFCWRLLEQWKALIIIAFCVMTLFLCVLRMHYVNNVKIEEQIQVADQEMTAKDIIDALPQNEQTVVESAYRLWVEREYYSDFIKTSPIMQIDPNHAKRLRVSWSIDKADARDVLDYSYVIEVLSENYRKALHKASGLDSPSELFYDLVFITYPNEKGEDVICVDIFLTDEMRTDGIQTELKNQIENTQSKLMNEVRDHQIKNYHSEVAIVSDERVSDKQTKVLNNFINANNQLNGLYNTLSASQKEALSKLQKKEMNIENHFQKLPVPKTITLRNILIGLILGIIIYVISYTVYLVLSNRIINTDVISGASVRMLAEWYDDSRNRKTSLIRDGYIWNKHHKNHLDKDKEILKGSNTILGISRRYGISTILIVLVGQRSKFQEEFIQSLSNQLQSVIDVMITEVDRTGYFDDNLIVNASGIVLVVIDSKTRIKKVGSILDRCDEYNKPLIGCVYLG